MNVKLRMHAIEDALGGKQENTYQQLAICSRAKIRLHVFCDPSSTKSKHTETFVNKLEATWPRLHCETYTALVRV